MENQVSEDSVVGREEFNRYKRFQNMQASSLFVQIEQLKDYIRQVLPIKEIPKQRRETLDHIVNMMNGKINFLEAEIRNIKYSSSKEVENDNKQS